MGPGGNNYHALIGSKDKSQTTLETEENQRSYGKNGRSSSVVAGNDFDSFKQGKPNHRVASGRNQNMIIKESGSQDMSKASPMRVLQRKATQLADRLFGGKSKPDLSSNGQNDLSSPADTDTSPRLRQQRKSPRTKRTTTQNLVQ